MTSSLVGSEMCIRDRLGERQSRPDVGMEMAELTPRKARVGYVQDGGTVSYTHLTLPTICSV
eukprot:2659946-Prorocentrum_lima.AAC.1